MLQDSFKHIQTTTMQPMASNPAVVLLVDLISTSCCRVVTSGDSTGPKHPNAPIGEYRSSVTLPHQSAEGASVQTSRTASLCSRHVRPLLPEVTAHCSGNLHAEILLIHQRTPKRKVSSERSQKQKSEDRQRRGCSRRGISTSSKPRPSRG